MDIKSIDKEKIAVVGLGYVGLPLVHAFAAKGFQVVGFDVSLKRVTQLRNKLDVTRELEDQDFKDLTDVIFTTDINDIAGSNCYIVTVPTPVDRNKTPDLGYIKSATLLVGKILGHGDLVVYESTVFPGTTEEVCIPILEAESKLEHGVDFEVAYSPERINPGDKVNRLTNILKIVSISNPTPFNKDRIVNLYSSIIDAGVHFAPTLKVAEAAKVCENIQRDVNISLMNELSMLFSSLGIDTGDVLEAAATKWNFLNFKPGFVGGHCIGIDPYYLVYKARETTKRTELISAARTVNESYISHAVDEILKSIVISKLNLASLKLLILGATFKENCPDMRNSKIVDIYRSIKSLNIDVSVYDPVANKEELTSIFCSDNLLKLEGSFDVILYCVDHDQFSDLKIQNLRRNIESLIIDFKAKLPKDISNWRP